jgi:DnaK suppressor protein
VDKELLKQHFEKEIAKTRKKILQYKDMTQPVTPDDSIGRISRMDAIQNQSISESALRQAEENLKKLLYMQIHINDEDFGICVKCHAPIPPGRLILMPQSRFCVKCS